MKAQANQSVLQVRVSKSLGAKSWRKSLFPSEGYVQTAGPIAILAFSVSLLGLFVWRHVRGASRERPWSMDDFNRTANDERLGPPRPAYVA